MYATFNVEDNAENPVSTSIFKGNYTIGPVSNLTGALVGKNVYVGGTWGNALYIGTEYTAGQTGTFDLELNDSNGEKIIVTYTITITA